MSRRQPRSVAAVLSGTRTGGLAHQASWPTGEWLKPLLVGQFEFLEWTGAITFGIPSSPRSWRTQRAELSCESEGRERLVRPSFHGTSAHERRQAIEGSPSPPELGRNARVFASRLGSFFSQSAQSTVCLFCNSSSRIFNGLPQRPQFTANGSLHSASGMQQVKAKLQPAGDGG